MKSMFLKQSILFMSVFAISGGATMFMLYEKSTHDSNADTQNSVPAPSGPVELTPAQALINSVMSYKSMSLNGDINISKKDHPFQANLHLDGKVDISDLEALKLQASLGVDASAAHVDARLTYYGDKDEEGKATSTIYMDYNDSHFKLANAAFGDFMDMIPTTGGVELPPIFENIDISSFVGQITDMVPSKVGLEDGITDGVTKYVFKLPELIPGLDLFMKSDDKWNFSGVMSNTFLYEGFFFKLAFDVKGNDQDAGIVNPETADNAPIYYDFKPALNLFPGMKNLFGKEQNTIGLNIGVTIPGNNGSEPMAIGVGADLSYDTVVGDFSVAASVSENSRTHSFKTSFANGTMYLNQEDVNKVYFTGTTLEHLINWIQRDLDTGNNGQVGTVLNNIVAIANNANVTNVIEQIKKVVFINNAEFQESVPAPSEEEQAQSEDQMNNTLDQVMNILNTVQNLNNWVKHIEVSEGQTIVHLDLAQFGLNVGDLQLIFNSSSTEFLGFALKNLEINGVGISVELQPKEFNIFRVSEEEAKGYIQLDPIAGWLPGILTLAGKNAFGVTIDGTIGDMQKRINPTTIEGGFQFNLLKKYGFGNATITEPNTATHVIKADCKENGQLLLHYNNLKGFMDTASLLDMGKTVADVLMGADAGFNNAFMKVLSGLQNTPIYKAMQGDIGAALMSDAFKLESFEYDDQVSVGPGEIRPVKAMNIAISGKLMGMDDKIIHIQIVANNGLIESIEIPGLTMDGVTEINMSLKIGDYDKSKDDQRLEFFENDYLNLNDLKVLLKLGIKTSSFEYYHLTGNIQLKLIGITMKNFIIDVNATVRNDKGHVEVIARMPSIPKLWIPVIGNLIVGEYDNLDGRGLSFTYKDGIVYGSREDRVSDGIFGWNKRTVIYRVKATEENFTNNLMYYLLDYGFGLNPSILQKINDGTKPAPTDPNAPTTQTHYEEIISGFNYTKGNVGQTPDSFQVDLNMSILTGNNLLTNTKVFLYSNLEGTFINRVKASMDILAGVLSANVDLNMDTDVDTNAFATDLAGLVACGDEVTLSDQLKVANIRIIQNQEGQVSVVEANRAVTLL